MVASHSTNGPCGGGRVFGNVARGNYFRYQTVSSGAHGEGGKGGSDTSDN